MLKVVKANKSDEYARALSTNFKTLSYFAALWYLDPDSPEYRHTLRNIKGHYLLDALTGVWSSAGDQRLLEYQPSYKKRDYLTPVDQRELESAFDQWLSSNTAGIRFNGGDQGDHHYSCQFNLLGENSSKWRELRARAHHCEKILRSGGREN